MSGKVVDLILIYQFIKRLTTPFDKTEAFKLGIIDKSGKKIKKPSTSEEQKAYGYFDRLVFNVKKLIELAPGGKSKLASYAAALFLIRESMSGIDKEYTKKEIANGLYEAVEELEKDQSKTFKMLREDAPTNATGANVSSTGDDVATHKDKKELDGRTKKFKSFLKRFQAGQAKRKAIKQKKDFMKQFGLD